VPDNQSVHLEFDGDPLVEEALVESTDISDMDVIEVHIA